MGEGKWWGLLRENQGCANIRAMINWANTLSACFLTPGREKSAVARGVGRGRQGGSPGEGPAPRAEGVCPLQNEFPLAAEKAARTPGLYHGG